MSWQNQSAALKTGQQGGDREKGPPLGVFRGVAAKRLSAVEADILRSNQHEFNGVEGLRALLDEPEGKVAYPSTLLYLSDEEPTPQVEEATLPWYDARQKARQE